MANQSKMSQVFNYQNLIHAVSGAAGGCIAMTTFYPLDTVRARQQLEDLNELESARSIKQEIKAIVLNEGFSALYRGLGPVLQSLCLSNFVYFYAFHALKNMRLGSHAATTPNALNDLFLGSIAGVINVLLTTPFWVVNCRLRMRDVPKTSNLNEKKFYNSLLNGLIFIAKTEGIGALWSGAVPSLLLVTNPALQFMMYEALKRRAQQIFGPEISSIGYFIIGAAAKAFATILTYPLQLVQTKQRHQRRSTRSKHSTQSQKSENEGILQMMLNILKHHGIRGLFRGLKAKVLQTVLTAALMFMAYEKIANVVGMLLRKN